MSPVELGQQVNLHKLTSTSLGIFHCYRNVENFFSISVQKSRVLVITNSLQILDLAPNSVQSGYATCVEIYELESLQKMNLRKESKSITLLFLNGKSVTYINMEHLHQCAECIKKAMERIGMEGTIVSKSPSSTPHKDSTNNNNISSSSDTTTPHTDVGSYVTLARQLESEFSIRPSMQLINAIMDILRQAVEKSSELNTFTNSSSSSSSSRRHQHEAPTQINYDNDHGNGTNNTTHNHDDMIDHTCSTTTTTTTGGGGDGGGGQYQETVELIQKFLRRADVATLLDSMIDPPTNNTRQTFSTQSMGSNSSKKSVSDTTVSLNDNDDDGDHDDRISTKSNLEHLVNGMTDLSLDSNKVNESIIGSTSDTNNHHNNNRISSVTMTNAATTTTASSTTDNAKRSVLDASEPAVYLSWQYYNAAEMESIDNLEYSFNDNNNNNNDDDDDGFVQYKEDGHLYNSNHGHNNSHNNTSGQNNDTSYGINSNSGNNNNNNNNNSSSGGRGIDVSDELEREFENLTDEFNHLTESFRHTDQS